MEEIFDAPEWLAAMTLAERVALLAADAAAAPAPQGIARAMRTIERWRRESQLLDDTLFRERLAADGLTPDLFVRALAEPVDGLRRRLQGEPPSWLQLLARAFAAPAGSLPPALPLPPVPGEGEDGG